MHNLHSLSQVPPLVWVGVIVVVAALGVPMLMIRRANRQAAQYSRALDEIARRNNCSREKAAALVREARARFRCSERDAIVELL